MRSELSSLDVKILAHELNTLLEGARVRNVYQIGDHELKIKLFFPGEGNRDLIIASNYLCLSSYERSSPSAPTSYAMQLRKHLKGCFIRKVKQADFDRIIEFVFEGKQCFYLLVAELFGSGNIIFCDKDKKILGVLEWQKWQHRRIGVGELYHYPPAGINPLTLDRGGLDGLIEGSEKNVVSFLASDLNLGGLLGEELCLRAGIKKQRKISSLEASELDDLFKLIRGLGDLEGGPVLVSDDEGNPVAALPFSYRKYEGLRIKKTSSFNQAVDELFSNRDIGEIESRLDKQYEKKKEKLMHIKKTQEQTIKRLRKQEVDFRRSGDLIYQSMHELNKLLEMVDEARAKDYSWEEMNERLSGRVIGSLKILDVKKNGSIILDELK